MNLREEVMDALKDTSLDKDVQRERERKWIQSGGRNQCGWQRPSGVSWCVLRGSFVCCFKCSSLLPLVFAGFLPESCWKLENMKT